jgi:hypothetical protein
LQKNNIYFLLFNTIHDVLKVDKILKKEKVHYELVPVPRNLSSDCGMCVKLTDNLEEIKNHIKGIETNKCFFFDGKTYMELP